MFNVHFINVFCSAQAMDFGHTNYYHACLLIKVHISFTGCIPIFIIAVAYLGNLVTSIDSMKRSSNH